MDTKEYTQEDVNKARAERAQFQAMVDAMDANIPKITMEEIKPFFNDLVKEAAEMLERDGNLAPVCFLVKKKDEGFALDVMGLSFEDDAGKDRSIMVCRMHSVAEKCGAAMFLSESWVVEQKGDEASKTLKDGEYTGVMPSQHPDRQEAVIARVELMGEAFMSRSMITRDAEGKPSVNVEELQDFEKYKGEASMTGRLTNWLGYNHTALQIKLIDKWLEEHQNVRSH